MRVRHLLLPRLGLQLRTKPGLSLFALTFAVMLLLLVGLQEKSLLATSVLYLVCGALGALLVKFEIRVGGLPQAILQQYWTAYHLRLAVAAVLHLLLMRTPYGPWWDYGAGGGDELVFWNYSDPLVEVWRQGAVPHQDPLLGYQNYFGWLQIVAFIRFLSGALGAETVFNVWIFLCMAGALVVPYVYAMADRIMNRRVAQVAAALAFWLPEYWFYSASLLRDVLVSSLIIIFFHQVATLIHERFRWSRLVLAITVNFGLLLYLRSQMVWVNAAVCIGCVLWTKAGGRSLFGKRVVSTVGVVILMLGTIAAVAPEQYSVSALSNDRYLTGQGLKELTPTIRQWAEAEASENSLGIRMLSLGKYPSGFMQSLFLLVQPFPPWQPFRPDVPNMFPLKAVPLGVGAFAWLGFVAFLPSGCLASLQMHARRTIWVWGPAAALTLGMGFVAVGIPRWRLMEMPFLLILVAQGIVTRRTHRGVIFLTVATLLLTVVAYVGLKQSL